MSNLPATMKSAIPTPASPLSDKLNALVWGTDSPVVGPKSAAALRAYAEQPEPPLPQQSQVEVMIGKLAITTAQTKVSHAEATERLELYWFALKDVPLADLRWAFGELVKSATFLPTPAEVRAVAMKPGAKRRHAKSRARHLAWKHEQEWTEPKELIAPGDVKALLASVSIGNAELKDEE